VNGADITKGACRIRECTAEREKGGEKKGPIKDSPSGSRRESRGRGRREDNAQVRGGPVALVSYLFHL